MRPVISYKNTTPRGLSAKEIDHFLQALVEILTDEHVAAIKKRVDFHLDTPFSTEENPIDANDVNYLLYCTAQDPRKLVKNLAHFAISDVGGPFLFPKLATEILASIDLSVTLKKCVISATLPLLHPTNI